MEFQFQLIAQIFILFYTHPDFFSEKNDIWVWDVSVTLNNLQSVSWILTKIANYCIFEALTLVVHTN